MFGTDVVATYKGVAIEVNCFGEYEFTIEGLGFCGFRSLAAAKRELAAQVNLMTARGGGNNAPCPNACKGFEWDPWSDVIIREQGCVRCGRREQEH